MSDFIVYLPVEVADLLDVSSAAPADGQALLWDVATGQYVPGDVAADGAFYVPLANGDPSNPAYLFTPDGDGIYVEDSTP